MLKAYRRRHDAECLDRLAKKGAISDVRDANGQIDVLALSKYEKKFLLEYTGRDCRCAFWVRGTTDYGKKLLPQSLHAYTKDAADAKLKELNQPEAATSNITLAAAREKFLAECHRSGNAEGTTSKYKRTNEKLEEWGAKLRPPIRHLRDFGAEQIFDFLTTLQDKGLERITINGRITELGTFFRFCQRMDWIKDNPMRKIKRLKKPKSGPEAEEPDHVTLPLDPEGGDANYRAVLDAIPEYLNGVVHSTTSETHSPLATRPNHLIALAELMYETGLRISDAVHFRVEKMIFDEQAGIAVYTTRQIKTGINVTVYIPMWLAKELRSLKRMSPQYLFMTEDVIKTWKNYIATVIYIYLKGAGTHAGVPGVRPHRFRDSFAVNRLNEGFDLAELQKFLGHKSIKTTEMYYAPWVKSREDRLKARTVSVRNLNAPSPAIPPAVVPINKKRRAS